MEDAQIVDLMRNGNTEAFAEIIQRYESSIFRYLYRVIGNYDVTRDLTQDTFIDAYCGLLRIKMNISIKAWLYKIATNNAFEFHRRKRKITFVPLEGNIESERGKVESPTVSFEEQVIIREILAKIPKKQRTCMVLHFIEGFKYREISETLGITEEAVRKRVARGSDEFRKLYELREGI